MPLDRLPEELLLQVAFHLPDPTTPKHLKNLCLTSRKLRPIAQEALHTTARLSISCGCHPRVNAVVKLLRTLLDRPDLASKVRTLRFRAVRKCVHKLYVEQGFEFLEFRDRCVSKLKELGYSLTHPWQRSIINSIESAFGGLLLILLPNLTELDFWIKDHQRGPPSSEIISGLWGGVNLPEAIMQGWKNISHLVTGDASMLKCGIEFDKLTSLDLRTISIGTVLRLNGPGSLQGAENLQDLALTVSIQFADRPLVEKAEIEFSELLDALACRTLKNLRILFINDGYHIGDDLTTELNAGYFLDQLHSVQETLETLSITLETTEDDGELEWLVDMCQHPTTSLKEFTALKSLVIPQPFIFTARSASWNTVDNCQPNALPPNLEQMELLYPHEDVEEWAEGFLAENYYMTSSESFPRIPDAQGRLSNFKKLILTCREDVGIGASYFTDQVDKIWWNLSADHGIEAEVHDQLRDTRQNLAGLYEDDGLDGEGSVDENEDIEWEDDAEENGSEDEEPETSLPPSHPLSDQSIVLAHIRDWATPEGITADELRTALYMNWSQVATSVTWLLQDGQIRATGLYPLHRYHFVRENAELRRQNGGVERLDSEDDEEVDWETDDSMPELETYDPETLANVVSDEMSIASCVPSSVVVTPTSVLRCLRDGPDISEGMYIWDISRVLGTHDHGAVAHVVSQLVRDGYVGNTDEEGKVYFRLQNAELRAEAMEKMEGHFYS